MVKAQPKNCLVCGADLTREPGGGSGRYRTLCSSRCRSIRKRELVNQNNRAISEVKRAASAPLPEVYQGVEVPIPPHLYHFITNYRCRGTLGVGAHFEG